MELLIAGMLFFPEKEFYQTPQDLNWDYEDVHIQTPDQVKLHGWLIRPFVFEKKGSIIFFHGNAGNISHRLFKIKGWLENGYEVFLVDYRGYGKSTGKIQSENDVLADAVSAFDWLKKRLNGRADNIVLFGESLGTYPAIRLSGKEKTKALILEAPFTSFIDLGKIHYPMVPSAMVKPFAFSNRDWILKIQSPLLIIHGTVDEICPFPMAEELFELAPEPKKFFKVEGGRHNDLLLSAGESYFQELCEFASQKLL